MIMQHMQEQEKAHLEMFSGLVERRRVRPSALMPVWDIAGYVLGMCLHALCLCYIQYDCTFTVEVAMFRYFISSLFL